MLNRSRLAAVVVARVVLISGCEMMVGRQYWIDDDFQGTGQIFWIMGSQASAELSYLYNVADG